MFIKLSRKDFGGEKLRLEMLLVGSTVAGSTFILSPMRRFKSLIYAVLGNSAGIRIGFPS